VDIVGLPAQAAGPTPSMTAPVAFFVVLGALAVVSALGVVLFRNALRSALSLVVNFFTLAFLYFTLRAELLGITQIVVYTGAIMVLFLFVIMLLNIGAPGALTERKDLKRWGGGVFGLALFLGVAAQVIVPLQQHVQPHKMDDFGRPEALGSTLFTAYVWPFEMASILLLVGIVGSILLAKRRM